MKILISFIPDLFFSNIYDKEKSIKLHKEEKELS